MSLAEPVAGVDYPTDTQLKAALQTLVQAIPEEVQGDDTYRASSLLLDFIDYNAQPDPEE
jgi:hypothetical protein